jgi:hypothetical protein
LEFQIVDDIHKGITNDHVFVFRKKYSMQKSIPTALAVLHNRNDLIESLENLMNYYHNALALRNSAKYWKSDFINMNLSYLLCKFFSKYSSIEDYINISVDQYKQIIFGCGLIENILDESSKYLLKSISTSTKLGYKDFTYYLIHLNDSILSVKNEMKDIRGENI